MGPSGCEVKAWPQSQAAPKSAPGAEQQHALCCLLQHPAGRAVHSASPAALPRSSQDVPQRGAAAVLAVPGRVLLAVKRLNLPNRSVRPSLRIYLLSAFQEHMDKIPLSRTYIYSIYY